MVNKFFRDDILCRHQIKSGLQTVCRTFFRSIRTLERYAFLRLRTRLCSVFSGNCQCTRFPGQRHPFLGCCLVVYAGKAFLQALVRIQRFVMSAHIHRSNPIKIHVDRTGVQLCKTVPGDRFSCFCIRCFVSGSGRLLVMNAQIKSDPAVRPVRLDSARTIGHFCPDGQRQQDNGRGQYGSSFLLIYRSHSISLLSGFCAGPFLRPDQAMVYLGFVCRVLPRPNRNLINRITSKVTDNPSIRYSI